MRAVAIVALLLSSPAALAASTFPVELTEELNGLAIEVTTSAGAVTVLTLVNKSPSTADCTAEFEGGLVTPGRRSTRVAAGKNATISYNLKGDVSRLRVKLVCKEAEVKK